MSTDQAVSYLRWKKEVDQHDYAAALSYLSIRFVAEADIADGYHAAPARPSLGSKRQHRDKTRQSPAAGGSRLPVLTGSARVHFPVQSDDLVGEVGVAQYRQH